MPIIALNEGARLVLEARDPSSGAAVSGVVAQEFVIYAADEGGGNEPALADIFLLPAGQ